jgi:hypothetical protein
VKHLLLSLLLIISVATIYAQQTQLIYASSTTSSGKSYFRLGDRVITIARHGAVDTEPYVLVSLHNNEVTSIQVGKEFVKEKGGLFIELQNDQKRIIMVDLYNRNLAVDPNRIFTMARSYGIQVSNRLDERIGKQITEFSQFLLNEMPINKTIVALHNNTNGEYSIRSYQKHPAIKRDAKLVHVNPEMDEDDFFYTTSKDIFDKLKEKNVNVVLQSSKAYDDGSLAIYCANSNRPYVTVETQIGHEAEQKKMLEIVADILK